MLNSASRHNSNNFWSIKNVSEREREIDEELEIERRMKAVECRCLILWLWWFSDLPPSPHPLLPTPSILAALTTSIPPLTSIPTLTLLCYRWSLSFDLPAPSPAGLSPLSLPPTPLSLACAPPLLLGCRAHSSSKNFPPAQVLRLSFSHASLLCFASPPPHLFPWLAPLLPSLAPFYCFRLCFRYRLSFTTPAFPCCLRLSPIHAPPARYTPVKILPLLFWLAPLFLWLSLAPSSAARYLL